MSRPPPFPGLPVRHRSKVNWGIVLAIITLITSLVLILNAFRVQHLQEKKRNAPSAAKAQPQETTGTGTAFTTRATPSPSPASTASPVAASASPVAASASPAAPSRPTVVAATAATSSNTAPQPEATPSSRPQLPVKEAQVGEANVAIPKPQPPTKAVARFQRASEAIRLYFQARSDQELNAVLRRPELAVPRREQWNGGRKLLPAVPFEFGPKFGAVDQYVVTTVKMADGTTRMMALEEMTDATFRIDWEGFAGYGEVSLAQAQTLVEGIRPLVRVVVEKLATQPSWITEPGWYVNLTHPDQTESVTAFVPAAVAATSPVQALLKEPDRSLFTLEITADQVLQAHGCVRITSVRCSGWMPDLVEAAHSALAKKSL